MKHRIQYFSVVILAVLLMLTLPSSVFAQSVIPQAYLCVSPEDEGSEPYLIEFFDSLAFGVLLPVDADVTIFTNTIYTVSAFTVNTSARTGGYLTMEQLGIFNTITQIPEGNPCLNADTRAIFAQLPYRTVPIPLSVNHALVMQVGDSATDLNNAFQRIISFTFGIDANLDEDPTALRNIQIIQMSTLDTFLNFRILDIEPNTPFLVTANKDFGIGQSLPDTMPPEFSRERPSDIRSFVKSDLADLYGLDIFDVSQLARSRIYINSGLIDTYRGTYILISLAPDTAERIPPFAPDVLVRALPDAKASFVAMEQVTNDPMRLNLPFDENPLGQLMGDSVYRVVEIEDQTGQLIIDFDGNPTIIESWLVEAIATDETTGD